MADKTSKAFSKIFGGGRNGLWRTEFYALSKTEVIAFCLLIGSIASFILLDIRSDLLDRESILHVILDSSFGGGVTLGLVLVWRRVGSARHREKTKILEAESNISTAMSAAQYWKKEAEVFRRGLAGEIERQFAAWSLTASEHEVAYLLLKGLSIKEISMVRNSAERTVRHHTLAIYAKAKVSGRAELSAYFLEDLLDLSLEATAPSTTPLASRERG